MARRYDSRTTIFSPEGRLYQVEYAMEAISNAGAALGVLASDGVVLAAEKRITSKVRGLGSPVLLLFLSRLRLVETTREVQRGRNMAESGGERTGMPRQRKKRMGRHQNDRSLTTSSLSNSLSLSLPSTASRHQRDRSQEGEDVPA